MEIAGPDISFTTNGVSQKQSCVSHSTPEAEIVAAAYAMRQCGLPAMAIWEILLKRKVQLNFFEDNESTIRVCKTGKNPTMRHLNRTHGVDVKWLYIVFGMPNIQIGHCKTEHMAADVFTKAITNVSVWIRNMINIRVVDPNTFWGKTQSSSNKSKTKPPSQAGGRETENPEISLANSVKRPAFKGFGMSTSKFITENPTDDLKDGLKNSACSGDLANFDTCSTIDPYDGPFDNDSVCSGDYDSCYDGNDDLDTYLENMHLTHHELLDSTPHQLLAQYETLAQHDLHAQAERSPILVENSLAPCLGTHSGFWPVEGGF